jgi:hypothetical protein
VLSYTARVREIQLDAGSLVAWIECPSAGIPVAGKYVLAVDPLDEQAPLATPLFPAEVLPEAFLAAPPIPPGWRPGTTLELRGPLGHGFSLPTTARNIALAALGESTSRLLPLVHPALSQGAAVALFTDAPLQALPTAVEAYPLTSLPEMLDWADFVAIDLPAEALPELRSHLGLDSHRRLPCAVQALVAAPMPCGGMGECGVCAVPARRGWKLACKDGPVFDLGSLW